MGVLTESMTRLRNEILALRHGRESLRGDLAESTETARKCVAALRLAAVSDLAGARRAWRGSNLADPDAKKS